MIALRLSVVALAVSMAAGCQEDSKSMGMKSDGKSPMMGSSASASSSPTARRTLYDRLGGEPAVTAVVDDFVARAASNPRVNFTRKGTAQEWQATDANVARLKRRLVQFIAMATGGPKAYEGRDMKSSHRGMMITSAEFDALAGDLSASLDKFKVPQREKHELLKIVGSTKPDIVESRM